MTLIGEFRVGEDIAVALDAVQGDPGMVDAITAVMRPATRVGGSFTIDRAATAIGLTVAARDDGWTLILSAAASAALAPGFYALDARLEVAGGVEITDETAFIRLTEAAIA